MAKEKGEKLRSELISLKDKFPTMIKEIGGGSN